MLKILKITLNFLFFLVLASSVQATNSLDVIINEIAWMGTKSSYNNEWIELYNNTDSSINLNDWALKAVDETPEISLTGTIPSKGFYLLERTDDTTIPNILANQIYTGASSNKGEYLKLFDSQNNLIDEANCDDGWFAGNNITKATMERVNPQLSGNSSENWQTSQNPEGTPKIQNSSSLAGVGSLQIEDEKVIKTKTPTITIYPTGIVINEILPSPEGPDAENEWIEVFNQNNFIVSLADWKIEDLKGLVHTFIFSKTAQILAKEFLVLSREITKITLNNDGDGLNLIQPNGKTIHRVDFEKASLAQSYNQTESGWFWSSTLTPGKENIVIKEESVQSEIKNIFLEDGTDNDLSKKELAAISQQVTEPFNLFNVLFPALILAFTSGIIILIFRKRTRSN